MVGGAQFLGSLVHVPIGSLAGQQPLEHLVGPLGQRERNDRPVADSFVQGEQERGVDEEHVARVEQG